MQAKTNMEIRYRTWILAVLAAALLIFAAGCGGEKSGYSEQTKSQSTAGAEQSESQGTAGAEQGESQSTETADSAQTQAQNTDNNDNNDNKNAAGKADHESESSTEEEVSEQMMQMKIGDTIVEVKWEDNESVDALKDLCKDEPLKIEMSMYGGFEQVGSLGSRLPRKDKQTTTSSGDIVLYSGNQMVVFYGSNSWAYTRLGHITDQDAAGMRKLLANGDVTITISMVNR